jgi:hypothetical protein
MQKLAQNVTGINVPLSGHWIPEERPDFVVKQFVNFFGSNNTTNTVIDRTTTVNSVLSSR